jgi:hypothetical protein
MQKGFLLNFHECGSYMISMAQTKDVATKGMINVNQGQWLTIANASAAVEIKKTSQAVPRYFLF